jgi:arylsulfatase A-like enzyme
MLARQLARPNLIIIFCDDLGYADLGCFGNRTIQTPNLDRLAAEGTRFTDLYSVSPVCTPSRAALMTGKYPQRFGIHHADLPESLPRYSLPESAVTLPQVLHDAGYYTAHIGKWHLGEPPEAPEPRKRGYDYFFGCLGGRPSSPWIKYARSVDPEMIENESRPQVMKGHVTDIQTDGAIRALQRAPKGKPFFLNLWYNAPHEPLAPHRVLGHAKIFQRGAKLPYPRVQIRHRLNGILSKSFRLGSNENRYVQYRFEAFNVLNRVNFANPNANINQPAQVGRIFAAGAPRILQMALKLYF